MSRARTRVALAPPVKLAASTWDDVYRFLLTKPRGFQVEIARGTIAHPTAAGALRSIGIPHGQMRDWRLPPDPDCKGVHAHEFSDVWRVHLDAVHPGCDLVGHLMKDVMNVGQRRVSTAWGYRRGFAQRRSLVGAPDPTTDLANYHSPASIDPALALRSKQKLTQYLAEHAAYGRIDFEPIAGTWYAFRFSLHQNPPNTPGVDYLVGPPAASTSTTYGLRTGLPAVAIVAVALLVLATSKK